MATAPAPKSMRLIAPETSRADQRALNVLAGNGLSNADVQFLRQSWLSARRANESLTEFLVRANVLRDDAPDLLAMNWSDELLLTGAADLFRTGGLEALWQLLGDRAGAKREIRSPGVNGDTTLEPHALSHDHSQTPVMRKPRTGIEPKSAMMPRSCTVISGAAPESENAAATTATASLTSGQLLGRCLITGRIAEGSYGAVYRALHRTLNIPVAVKVLHPELLDGDTKAGQHFRSEAMLLARLNHPNIVRLWDFDDSVAPPYLVLEFIEGSTVADLIQRRNVLRVELSIRIILQVIDGLDAAYKLSIIHRDIKPANILITRDEKAKIADLGLATVMNLGRQLGQTPPSEQSPLAGTVAYLAPEQAGKAASFDHRSDIYSLGATFYHMITGRLPFNGKSSLEVLMKHAREKLTPPNEVVPSIDRGVSDLIVRMMAKDPAGRFRNYEDLRDMLIDVDIALQSHIAGLTDEFRRM